MSHDNQPAHRQAVTQAHAAALLVGRDAVEGAGRRPADGVIELLEMGSNEYWRDYSERAEIERWTGGHWIVCDNVISGMAGYIRVPGADDAVEIGYGVVSEYQRRVLAAYAARELARRALASGDITRVIADTLQEPNASTRVLEKCGFVRAGEDEDPDEGIVWRWERRDA